METVTAFSHSSRIAIRQCVTGTASESQASIVRSSLSLLQESGEPDRRILTLGQGQAFPVSLVFHEEVELGVFADPDVIECRR